MAKTGDKRFICVGQFAGPHGLKGGVKLKSFTEKPENLKTFPGFYLEGGLKPLAFTFKNPTRGGFVVEVPGVDSPEAASALKGKKIFVRRADLPNPGEGEYYLSDLEGLAVKSPQGKTLGQVEKIYDFGAGPVLEVGLKEPVKNYGKTLMIPFKTTAIERVEPNRGLIVFNLDAWLADEDEG